MFVVVVVSLASCGLLAVASAVDYVEYCTGYPVVDCGPMSLSDLGWLLLGWSLLGLIPKYFSGYTRVLLRTGRTPVKGPSSNRLSLVTRRYAYIEVPL